MEDLVNEFPQTSLKSKLKEIILPAGVILAIIVAGGITGWFLANRGGKLAITGGKVVVQGPKEAGVKDTKLFPDNAEGKIEINNDENISEGSHKLVRSGGPSQTAYLTSSVVDLNQFLGKCVKIWGETFAAQKVAWLMDVGRIQILDKCPEGI